MIKTQAPLSIITSVVNHQNIKVKGYKKIIAFSSKDMTLPEARYSAKEASNSLLRKKKKGKKLFL